HPLLFSAITSIWNSIGIFGGMLLVNLYCTFSFPVRNIMCIASLLCSLLLVSILSFFSLRGIMKFSRIFLENIKVLLIGALDSFYYFLVSCLIFDVLKAHITDSISLILTVLACAGISNLMYAYFKNSFLV
ncbi:MAG: hypothetical protein IJ497_08820, partial [Clostridia bacterium]|nr:hypothetical protein [Clostridia bacterium]